MIKKLFFSAALLAPGLAYGGNPTADLSVKIVPPTSAACGTVPADVATVGFTTVALCNDFTTAIPNAVGTGLPSNWLNCDGTQAPVAGNVWHLWALAGGGTTIDCATQIVQATDTNGGGGLALKVALSAAQLSTTNGYANLTSLATIPWPNYTGWNNTNSWAHGYFEWTWRTEWDGGQGYGVTANNLAFWSDHLNALPRWEPDWFETIYGCCDTGLVGHGSDATLPQMRYNIDQSVYHTLGVLYTGNSSDANGALCTYIDGKFQACMTGVYAGGVSDSSVRSTLQIWNAIECNAGFGDVTCQTPPHFSYVNLWIKSIRVLTCSGGPSGDACLTPTIFTR